MSDYANRHRVGYPPKNRKPVVWKVDVPSIDFRDDEKQTELHVAPEMSVIPRLWIDADRDGAYLDEFQVEDLIRYCQRWLKELRREP